MINSSKLAEGQKNQRAKKTTNRILKQTHEKQLASSFERINKKVTEVKESTNNYMNYIKNTSTNYRKFSKRNIFSTGYTKYTKRHTSWCIKNISMENTIRNMKNKSNFHETVDEQIGDIYWNRFELKKMGGKKIQPEQDDDEKYYSIQNIQDAVMDKTFLKGFIDNNNFYYYAKSFKHQE